MNRVSVLLSAALFLVALGSNGCAVSTEDGASGDDVSSEELSSKDYAAQVLFKGGSPSLYHSYRIPSIVRAADGTLIAFAEGRIHGPEDYGDINVVQRRSVDDGKTWGPVEEVAAVSHGTWGNPTSVLDRTTGELWLFLSYNDADHSQSGGDGYQPITKWGQRKVYSLVSKNDGKTWEKPVDRTEDLVPKTYAWDAVGPGAGIQISEGPHKGRLVVPAIGRNLISDDHGKTWTYEYMLDMSGKKLGGTSESTVVELAGGGILRNDRASSTTFKDDNRRIVSRSNAAESVWTDFAPNKELLDPLCEGSTMRYSTDVDRIVFLNPASTVERRSQRFRISYDGGKTWPVGRTLGTEFGGYSAMTKTDDFHIAALSELRASGSEHRSIELTKVDLAWILNGANEKKFY